MLHFTELLVVVSWARLSVGNMVWGLNLCYSSGSRCCNHHHAPVYRLQRASRREWIRASTAATYTILCHLRAQATHNHLEVITSLQSKRSQHDAKLCPRNNPTKEDEALEVNLGPLIDL